MKIITLTLNPAYDIHCRTERLCVGKESLLTPVSRDAGGKGINIARALSCLGLKSKNLVVLGEDSGADFLSLLEREGLSCVAVSVPCRIRENITVTDNSGVETRLSFPGFSADEGLLLRIGELLYPETDEDTVVTFSGRLPEGISHASVMDFLLGFKARGARLVLDTHALSREDLVFLGAWLVKPNGEEAPRYLGENFEEGAIALSRDGVENVFVSLGEDGGILASGGELYRAKAPKIEPRSTVGAGDSSIAGFIYAVAKGASKEAALGSAVALGSAACLTEGTAAPSREEFERLLSEI